VLDYFDAFIIGLTATPNKQAFGFFNQNLVMEYTHEQAVADQVNVDFDVYRIRTKITEQGSTIDAGLVTAFRDRQTRGLRWETLDEEVAYGAQALDRAVVAKDQIRTVARAFRERLFTEIFPGRTEVPKTLIFAKDDPHADDIVQIVREEFGKGDDFAVKITYKSTGRKPDEMIAEFRNSYNPRIAVTVDMIATGTDVRPLECVFFMRAPMKEGAVCSFAPGSPYPFAVPPPPGVVITADTESDSRAPAFSSPASFAMTAMFKSGMDIPRAQSDTRSLRSSNAISSHQSHQT
jgi:type I restriction enzyme, R subunit